MLYEKGGEVITIDEDAGVQDAARLMRETGAGRRPARGHCEHG
jgi:CBS domain-containing protein